MEPSASTRPRIIPPRMAPTEFPKPPITAAISAFRPSVAPTVVLTLYIGAVNTPAMAAMEAEMA